MLVKDAEAPEKLLPTAVALLSDNEKIESMQKNIAKLSMTRAADIIAEEAYKLVNR